MARDPDENGWLSSSDAWLERTTEEGDFSRQFILDRPMQERALASQAATMLDVGCGEGRFCRMMKRHGIRVTGIDPVEPLIRRARQLDPEGRYVTGYGESLPFEDCEFQLVVFYLSLIDIDELSSAVRQAARVLKPGGTLLLANLTSFFTSNGTTGWIADRQGREHHPLGTYLEEKAHWVEWDGLRVRNWHRPLSTYMTAFLEERLVLTYFDEPLPSGGPTERVEKYRKTPFTMIMEWRKPS